MNAAQSLFGRRSDVRYRRVGDEAVVVCQESAEILVLNGVGARVLELVDGRTTVDEMVDRLAGEYSVERDRLYQDIEGFIDQLRQSGIIEPVTTPEAGDAPETGP